MKKKIIAFDCDSTLSEIEGIDELARLSDPATFAEVEKLTHQAMNGELPIDEIFTRRLELIRPSQKLCQDIAQLYIEKIEPTALETISKLQKDHWHCLILSGGFENCITPFAHHLGISHVEAVPLYFDEHGLYHGFDADYPTTRNGGKTEILAALAHHHQPDHLIMVGDGISDLETTPVVEKFIAYTGYIERPQVINNTSHICSSLSELMAFL